MLWLICGDSNATLSSEDRPDGRCDASTIQFQQLVHELELVDLPSSGSRFTWRNGNGAVLHKQISL
jgi:hypothetical protein